MSLERLKALWPNFNADEFRDADEALTEYLRFAIRAWRENLHERTFDAGVPLPQNKGKVDSPNSTPKL